MAQEKNYENKIKKFLKEKNIWHVKYFANAFTKSGIPDILACVNGKFIAIEVKADNGKPSELQLYHQQKIKESGGKAYILYPKDFEQFKRDIESEVNNGI